MDWAAYLEYLQTVFQEFDANVIILKPVLIHLFRNGLKLFIYAQTNQNSYQKNICEEFIKETIIPEAKAALNLLS